MTIARRLGILAVAEAAAYALGWTIGTTLGRLTYALDRRATPR